MSGICTNRLTLEEDLAFWGRHGIVDVGVPLRKVGNRDAQRVADAGVRVSNLLAWGRHSTIAPLGPRITSSSSLPSSKLPRCAEKLSSLRRVPPVLSVGRKQHSRGASLPSSCSWAHLSVCLLEHTNQLRHDVGFVHSLRDAVDLARPVEVGVVVEVNVCWMERGLALTLAEAADLIGLVQVSDTMPGTHCTPDRAVPGDGIIPLGRVLGEVLATGYDGAFDLEMIGPRIEAEGYERAVPRAVSSLRNLLDGIDHRRAESGHR